jgi:hypothetical protein
MRLAINRRVYDSEQRFRVIPVLLPGARESLPAFPVNAARVEFRGSIAPSMIRILSTLARQTAETTPHKPTLKDRDKKSR